MQYIDLKLQDHEFREWSELMMSKFQMMVQTMEDVASLVQANTYMKVPLDTGRLEESYHWQVVENTSDFIKVEVIFDAEDPDTGFHYAEIQHNTLHFNHPKRGQAFYLYAGIQASRSMAYSMIETDYLSLFGI